MNAIETPSSAPAARLDSQGLSLRQRLSGWSTPLLWAGVLLFLMLVMSSFAGASLQRTTTEMLIRLLAVIGMFVFIGNSGVISFGHVAFIGVGAYAAAWVAMDPAMKQYVLVGLPEWMLQAAWHWLPASLFGAVLAACAALCVGAVLMRLAGIAASIATFALLAIFGVVYANWDSVTAGTSSIVGIPTEVGIWQAGALAVLALFVAHAYSRSASGLALQAHREEPIAAQACGVHAWRHLLIAFVLSAALCGLAGALDAQFVGVVNPDAYYLDRTSLLLAMLVVGGMGSLSGAVLGVLLLSLIKECLYQWESGIHVLGTVWQLPTGAQEITIGVWMIVMLMLRPAGLLAGRDWRF